MRAAKVAIVVLLLLGAFSLTPARAANYCTVVATGYPGTPGDCRYVATSASGTYAVETLSGFIISASSDGGLHYRTIVAHISSGDATGGMFASAGQFEVKVGDIVVAAIAHARAPGPNGTTTIQDGHITVTDS